MAEPGVQQYRVSSGEHPVHDTGIAAVLKIQIAADIIHQDKILMDHFV